MRAAEDPPVKRFRPILTIALATLAAGAQAVPVARAADFSSQFGFTLNPIVSGVHESFNDRRHVPPVPIPLVDVSARYGRLELDIESLPPLASIRSFDSREGHTSTQLSLFDSLLRVWDAPRRLSAGIGQTLYNQSTHYRDPIEVRGSGESQFSRISGLDYQAGYRLPWRRGHLEATFNYAPEMLGTQYTLYDHRNLHGRADPERAKQISTAVTFVRPAGRRGEFIFGVRYINFTASYVAPGGGLSDRNVGLLAVVGYRTRFRR